MDPEKSTTDSFMTHQAATSGLQQNNLSADDPMSDVQLMNGVKSGDKLAFSQLYDRYAAAVYGVGLRILRRQAEAEVVVSDVFWEIWRKPDGFDPLRGSCCTYLLTLARSRAIDQFRASATRNQKTQAAMQEAMAGALQHQDIQEPYEVVLTDERRQAVRKAVGQLDSEQREALLLAYFDGLTHLEISQHLDKPLGTVKTHIRRGLQILKVVLRSLGEQDELQ